MLRRLALIFALQCCAWAEKPSLEGLFPIGAAPGSTNAVTLLGKFDPWPPKLWCSGEGLAFNFETNKGKAQLTIASDAKPGPRLLRLYNEEGSSEARIFVISSGPEELEREPNDHFRKAQSITNENVTVEGRLERNGDVDSFALDLKSGDWLDARLESYVLMSKLDPVLRLVTTNGYQLAWNHDFGSLDPRLIWRSPRDQIVVLQVFGFLYPANAEIQLSGGAGGYYRLNLGRSATNPLPHIECSSTDISLGGHAAGVIRSGAKPARYKISVSKDQWIEARAAAYEIGSPLDPWLSIEDAQGKELTRNDDAENTRDSRIEWKAPADGDYVLTVGSVTQNGRDDFRYELRVQELKPSFAARIAEDNFTIPAGTTNNLKATVQRLRGFTNVLALRIAGLPEQLAAQEISDTKGGEITLPIIASTNAPAWNGPIKLLVKDTVTAEETPALFELVSRTENNGVPGGYSKLLIDSVEDLWLTVRPPEKK